MSENRVVNGLIEALDNAPGKHRKPIHVGRLLIYCQQKCPEWFRECGRYQTEEWIRIMIDPDRKCDRW